MLKEIEERRSVRKYLDKAVDDEKITEVLQSARCAPSGSNTQPWHFIVVKSKEKREKVAEVCHKQKWMLSAPVFIVCVGDMRSRIDENVDISVDENSKEEELKQVIRDTAIAAEHIVLEAKNLGLDSCWVAWFTQNDIRPVLDIPDDKYVLSVIVVGYGAEKPNMRPRKKIEDMIHMEKW